MKSSEKGAPYPNLWGLQWLSPINNPPAAPSGRVTACSRHLAPPWHEHQSAGAKIARSPETQAQCREWQPNYPPIKHSNGKSLKKMEVSLAGKIIRFYGGFPASHVCLSTRG